MKPSYSFVWSCLFSLSISLHAASPVVISEFMASNRSSNLLNQVFGPTAFPAAPDWIEIHNVSSAPVNLLNWSLTDNAGNLAKWRFPETSLNAGAFLVIAASGVDHRIPGAPLHADFNLDGGGEYLALVQPDGTIASEFAPAYPPQATDVAFGYGIIATNQIVVSTNAAAVRAQIPTSGVDGINWTLPGFDDSTWLAGTNAAGYGVGAIASFIKTDLRAMSNVNATAYLRFPFTLSNPSNVVLLVLRLRYDDGFVAWINGAEAVRANAPASPEWNSTATAIHATTVVEEFRLGPGTMLSNNNVLAIQGLNISAADVDLLILPELTAVYSEGEATSANFLVAATPGSLNAAPSSRGPLIREVGHTPNVPADDQDLHVSALVTRTFNAVTNVTLFYRFMFGTETNTPMFDDGGHGDGAAGDGIFGATLPAAAGTTNGQMIRYYVRAADSAGQLSRWPPFPSPASTEYLGTIVEPVGLSSPLPIVHLFAPATVLGPGPTTPQTGADSQAGARGVAVFHDGEFYDNISMQLRGNSTSGFNKKSHRLEFNSDHQFRHSGPGPRLRKTSFVADYPDPTYMRQGLGYWLCDLMGSPGPFYIPHRLQLNGAFYQLANHNDVHGEELLERLGLDPNGALYNAAGQVTPGRASTGGFEKKTRRWDSDNDYATMSSAIGEANPIGRRETNFFDLYDIPNALNYLVAARWFHENDDVWANLSLYHDNDGDDQWKIIPFDVNLSWGAIFYEGGNTAVIEGVQSTNDIHKAHPLYGSSQTLALSGPGGAYNRVYDTVFLSPVLREMFLRRLRTLMDTYVQPPETHPLARIMENKARTWRDLIAPEAALDRTKWSWPAKGGQCNFDPGITLFPGVDAMNTEFIGKRRLHFYIKHCVTNATALFPVGVTKTNNAGIPVAQPSNALISVAGVEYNPTSGNQAQEYIVLTNPQPYAVDISDWKLSGGVEFTFHKGTVIPANRAAYLTPDVRAFRARTTGPRGGQGLFVIGPYQGQLSSRGENLVIHDPTGRLVYTNVYSGSPSLAQQFLRVSEIMYHPTAVAGLPTDPEEFEYIELKNISTTDTISLSGVHFTDGITFNFTGSAVTSLTPGARALVVKNATAFGVKYGPGLQSIAGQYAGSLDNSGERLRLLDASNEEILDFSYNNSWYPITDGVGFSLVIVDDNSEADAWGTRLQWRPSGTAIGSPGAGDPPAPTFSPIVISELLTHSDPPQVDYIELHNPSTSSADISGWYITDDHTNVFKYRIPNNTIVPPGGYVTFTEAQFNPNPGVPPSFSFSSQGDEAFILSADAGGQLTGYHFGYEVDAAATDVSFGQYTNSQGDVHFVAQSARTPNGPNSGPLVGPVVISEIMYHPVDGADGEDNGTEEFVELRNISDGAVLLYDPAAPTNTWHLRGDVDLDLPSGLSLAPGGYLILANIDSSNPAIVSALRSKYGIPGETRIVGPYEGKLDNNGGAVRLYRPDVVELNDAPYILVDEVEFTDLPPWDPLADGTGASLQRRNVAQYGNDPINWIAAAPSAGKTPATGSAPVITAQPVNVSGIASQSAVLSVTATGPGLKFQWFQNGAPVAGAAVNSVLSLTNLKPEDAGTYSVLVYNSAGAVMSSSVTLTILYAAFIAQNPTDVDVRIRPDPGSAPTTNATFNVTAVSGNPPVAYQWRRNGVNIPGANAATLTIVNVTTNDFATYDCAITDRAGTVVTAAATLYPLIRSGVLVPPLAQTVVPGSLVGVSCTVTGFPPPFGFEWRIGTSVLVASNAVDVPHNALTFTATNQPGITLNYRVVVRNRAFTAPGSLAQFPIVTGTDTDGDGILDTVEDALGLNKNDPLDGAGDLDGDRVSNRDETIAGTNPNDPASYLKFDPASANGGRVILTFGAKANKTYSIQYKDDLNSGLWSRLTDIVALPSDYVASATDATARPNRVYRIITPAQK